MGRECSEAEIRNIYVHAVEIYSFIYVFLIEARGARRMWHVTNTFSMSRMTMQGPARESADGTKHTPLTTSLEALSWKLSLGPGL